ncbi:MAG: hypothetical protein J6S67_04805 [Methanobrevibacter sp.]|nr:hypothetical protein [Methanobrevibacter sp.]
MRLINTGEWKNHPTFYRRVENAWQLYICNIENYVGKKLVDEGFGSDFANTKYSKVIYVNYNR